MNPSANPVPRTLTLLLAVVLLAAGGTVSAQQMSYGDPGLEPVFRSLPANVEILDLENGLQVLLMRNTAQPMVGIYTQVKVGSAREDYRTSGMSHMLEHLLFNGSQKYTQEELYDLADSKGAYNNANTADFFTNYMLVLPAGELEAGLDIQSQMLFHSLIPEEKFEKEKGIVLGEIVQGRDWPGSAEQAILRRVLYEDSCLEMPTLGTRSTIEHMQRDDVYDFYRRWYVPNNMILTLAGNFDRDEAVALLEEYYGKPAPGTLDPDPLRSVAMIDRTRTLTRQSGSERLLTLSFAAPTFGMYDFFPFLVMTDMLGLDGTGLLTRVLDDLPAAERPEFSAYWDRAPGFGRLNLQFTLRDGTDPAVIYGLVQDAVTSSLEMGIDAEDLLGIVRMSETQTLLEREQLRMTGIYIAESLVLGGIDFFLGYLDALRDVTAEDVSRALTNWLIDAPCVAVLIEPDPNAAPAMGGMGGMMGMPPGMPRGMPGSGDAEKPETPGTTAPPAAAPELRVDRSVLDSGAVLVSQTNAGSPLTAIHVAVRNRALNDRQTADAGALDLVHRLLEEGLAGCDKACLARRLRSLGVQVKLYDDPRFPMDNYYTNGRFSFIRIETASGNTTEVLDLVTELVKHAVFTKDQFERIKQDRISDLQQQQSSARTTANELLNSALYGEHPLVLPPEGTAESLAGLDYDQIRAVYRKAFAPENLVFSIVGPASHADLKEQLNSRLKGKGQPNPGIEPDPVTTETATVTASVGGEMTAVRLGTVFAVAPGDESALELAVAILSDRLGMDLRETRGLSYSVGASLALNGGRGRFTAWINPPAERLDEGRAALREAVAGFAAESITQEELDKIRNARTGRMMMRRLASMGQAYYLGMAELEQDLAGYLEGLNAYSDITLADLAAVTGRYLKTAPMVEAVVD